MNLQCLGYGERHDNYKVTSHFSVITLGFDFMTLDPTQCHVHFDILHCPSLLSCCSHTILQLFNSTDNSSGKPESETSSFKIGMRP